MKCGLETDSDIGTCPVDGSLLTGRATDPLIGTTIQDKYEITELLGRGGMSTVYKAKQLLMGRWVAIKFLRPELIEDALSLQRFQVESKAVGKVEHPNVMTIHDFGVSNDGVPYLVMELLHGDTLSHLLRVEHQIEPIRALNLFRQGCAALGFAHEMGVIHRDIKPSNLMVYNDKQGREILKLVDFGIAKLLETEGGPSVPNLTTTGEIFGSPYYMSPEQCSGKRADKRSDIYSFGCVVYETLLGVCPIRGESAIETLCKHVAEMPPSFAEARPDLKFTAELEAVVIKSLLKDPEARYQSMDEFDKALTEAIQHGAAPIPFVDDQEHTTTVFTKADVSDKVAASEAAKKSAEEAAKVKPYSIEATKAFDKAPVVASSNGDQAKKVDEKSSSSSSDNVKEMGADDFGLGSYDMFGNKLMPAAADTKKSSNDRGDRGNLGDKGNALAEEKLLPVPSSMIQSSDLASGALLPSAGVVDKSKGSSDSSSKSASTASGGAGSAVTTGESKTSSGTGMSSSTKAAIGVAVTLLLAAGGFVYKTNMGHSTDSGGGSGGTVTATASGTKLSANQVFKHVMPSVVTLTIITKSYQISVEGAELVDAKDTDSPIKLSKDDDDKFTLLQAGKPTKAAVGILTLQGKKLPCAIMLSGSTPVLCLLDGSGNPIKRNGHIVAIEKGVDIDKVTSTGLGSGFFVAPDVVATNCHVVGASGFAGGTAQITDNAAKYLIAEQPIVIDKTHDLALLFIPGTNAPVLPMKDYATLGVGDKVYALGSPMGQTGSLSDGEISSDRLRDKPGDPDNQKLYLQHTAKIDHGNSGGPLVDETGSVIGVNTAYMGNGAINLAVVTKYIQALLDKPDVQAKVKELSGKLGTDLKG